MMIFRRTNDYVSIFQGLLLNMYEVTEYNLSRCVDRYAQLEERSSVHPTRRHEECLLLKTTLVLRSWSLISVTLNCNSGCNKVGRGWLTAVFPGTRINLAAPNPNFPPARLLFPAGTDRSPFIEVAQHQGLLLAAHSAPVACFICSSSITFLIAILSCQAFLLAYLCTYNRRSHLRLN